MTGICSDGVTIACDGRSLLGWEVVPRATPKFHTRDNRIFAFSGTTAMCDALIEWYLAGHHPPDAPQALKEHGWSMVVIDPDGPIYMHNEVPFPDRIGYPFAIGSAGDFLLGAIAAGASPARAIELAIERRYDVGPPLFVVRIADHVKQPAAFSVMPDPAESAKLPVRPPNGMTDAEFIPVHNGADV